MTKNVVLKFLVTNTNRGAELCTDYSRLLQIFSNLIHNALKFTTIGSVTITFECLYDGRTRFTVSDTGDGLSDFEKTKLMQRLRDQELASSENSNIFQGGNESS